jgi:hypothetical protein
LPAWPGRGAAAAACSSIDSSGNAAGCHCCSCITAGGSSSEARPASACCCCVAGASPGAGGCSSLHRLRSDAMTAMTEASAVARAAEHLELEITRSRSDSMPGGAHNHAHFQVRQPASLASSSNRLHATSWRLWLFAKAYL